MCMPNSQFHKFAVHFRNHPAVVEALHGAGRSDGHSVDHGLQREDQAAAGGVRGLAARRTQRAQGTHLWQILHKCKMTLGSVHTGFGKPRRKQTQTMDPPVVDRLIPQASKDLQTNVPVNWASKQSQRMQNARRFALKASFAFLRQLQLNLCAFRI